jgi:hypothetical protein
MRRRPLVLHTLVLAALLAASPAAALAETVIERFPFVLEAGRAAGGAGVLPDFPFSPERGYGHVGGEAGALREAPVLGGDPAWPRSWREGMETYLFRVSRGEYLVALTFLETEAGAPGLRVFDVLAEERAVLERIDIAALAGDFAWVTLRALVSVHDGWLDLRFVAAPGSRPARVSRLSVERWESSTAGSSRSEALSLAVSALEAHGAPGSVLLRWDPPAGRGVVGYGVFRSESALGPYDALTEAPVRVEWFEDPAVTPGREHFYKVRAYSLDGRQGDLSAAAAAVPVEAASLGLKVYELRVPPDDLGRLLDRDWAAEVAAELWHEGAGYVVHLTCETEANAWQRKKTFRIELDQEENRFFAERRSLVLSAEALDPTLLCGALASEAASALALQTPFVEPVLLLMNGRALGVYQDTEVLDARFLRRARLDRSGLLVELEADDRLRPGWAPLGRKIGRDGDLIHLPLLRQALNRLGEGEIADFLRRNLYFESYLSWRALGALCDDWSGWSERAGGAAGSLLALRDSRNGRWQFFREPPPGSLSSACLPGADEEGGSQDLEERARAALLFPGLQAGASHGAGPEQGARAAPGIPVAPELPVLQTRLLNQPALRREYLERVEKLVDVDLAPERFDALVDRVFERVKGAALQDALLWWAPARREAFLAGPARLKAAFRARAEALKRAARRERERPPPALVLNELCARPGEGPPWIEVRNVSAAPVDTARYFLTDDPALPLKTPLAGGLLPPGERRLVHLVEGNSFAIDPAGGFLALFTVEDSGPRRGAPALSDLLHFGAQTERLAYGRLEEPGGGRWELLGAPTPGAANTGVPLVAPSYLFTHGVSEEMSGDLTLWLRPGWSSAGGEDSGAARVSLLYREAGESAYQKVDLAWDDRTFRHQITLEKRPARGRTEYYFLTSSAAGVERVFPLAAPGLTYILPVRPEVVINEILPRPSRLPGSPGEFIEIYNPSTSVVDIGGMYLSDSSRNSTKWRIPDGTLVPAKGFTVFHASGLDRGSHTNFRLRNSGEFLGLFGRVEEGNLVIDRTAFRGVRPGESWGRTQDGGKTFRPWKDPTPGGRNLPKIPQEVLDNLEKEPAETP